MSPMANHPGGPTIGILACDHVSPELRDAAHDRDYDEMYGEMLRAAEPSIRTRTYDVVGGELPASPAECDAWIITGARYDAYRDEPWIVALRKFIATVLEHQSRLVGVCFGHQAVAHALGGRATNTGTWKAGPQMLHVEDTPWFEGGSVRVNAMHQDVAERDPARRAHDRPRRHGRAPDVPRRRQHPVHPGSPRVRRRLHQRVGRSAPAAHGRRRSPTTRSPRSSAEPSTTKSSAAG